MDICLRFGNKVKELRQKKFLSQEKFAELVGIHRTYVSSLELGKRNVSLKNIEKIANALECEIKDLF